MKAVIDTNVIYSGLYSRDGASFAVLEYMAQKQFTPVISNSLIYEYEDVLTRNLNKLGLTLADINNFLDGLCLISEQIEVSFLWRPFLKDAGDDHVLELAFASGAKHITTHNIKDFEGSNQLGIFAILPKDFLKKLRSKP